MNIFLSMNRALATLAAVAMMCSVDLAHASCPVNDPFFASCKASHEDTNPYLRLPPEKVIELARSIDNGMAAGNFPSKNEFLNIYVALQRIGNSAAEYAEAQRLLDSIDKRNKRAAQQAVAEIKDDAARHRIQAIKKISACTDAKYKHHHSECGRRVMVEVPVEDRSKTFMDYVDLLARADQGDSQQDNLDALFDRAIRAEHFTRDLKAAKSSTEMLGVVTRYCTGHGEPRIGMTPLEVQQDTTWCVPSSINETITAGGKRQQYVYIADQRGSGGNTGFLYFENGRLVAIQRRH
jgi:hypothetical protein